MGKLNILRTLAGIFLLCSLSLVSGCGKPGGSSTNYTNSVVTVSSLNGGSPFQSDVLTNSSVNDDVIPVTLTSDFRVGDDDPTAPGGPTVYDTVTFRTYHVGYTRSDGGATPGDFTARTTFSLAPGDEKEISILVVQGFEKNRSPLVELEDDGEIVTSTTITFYGEDGYGNDVSVSGALTISFANFPDE